MKRKSIDFGHYAPRTAILTLGFSAAFDIVSYCYAVSLLVTAIVAPLTMIVLIVSLVALYLHARRLCEKCVRSMPLDCAQQAQKRRPHLRFMHLLDDNKKAYWVAVIALVLALFILSGLAAVVVSVFFKLSGAEIIYGSVVHKKLQPWCPWCGERGIEILTPDPTRNPAGTRV